MSYSALYRKFRPSDFGEVRGQDHIVTTLRNQLKLGRIGHAYLFTGTRGTGKTTVAKILAKAVNCEHPTEDGPCNQCEMCREIQAQNSMNVIELDAASNNSVDNIREIVEAVRYSPAKGKYKVYIIDEVHMLSVSAFNALLKTLEEPPSYVIFILATTEVHKIPITILSRCQRYDFHRITIDTISGHLRDLCDKENVKADEKALKYIAKAADGSMRDGLSLLDRCIAFYLGEELTYDKVLDVLGAVDSEVFFGMLSAVTKGDVKGALEVIEKVVIDGRELTWFVNEFTWYLRNLLIVSTASDCEEMVEMSKDNLELMKKQADTVSMDSLMRYIRVLSELTAGLKNTGQKRVLVEIAFIKLCRPQMETDSVSVRERLRVLEAQIEELKNNPVVVSAPLEADSDESVQVSAVKKAPERVILPAALDEDVRKVAKNWSEIIEKLPPPIQGVISKCTLSVTEGDECKLLLATDNKAFYGIIEGCISELKKIIEDYTGKDMDISVKEISQEEENDGMYPDIQRLMNSGVKVDIL